MNTRFNQITESARRLQPLITCRMVAIVVALVLVPVASQAESWGDMFKGMAREAIDRGQEAILGDDNDHETHEPVETNPQGQATSGQLGQIEPPAAGNHLGPHQIQRMQRDLQQLGYDPGPADGVMGQKTSQAIKQFERDTDLPVTGLPSPQVLAGIAYALQGAPSAQGDDTQFHTPSQLSQMTTPEGEFATAGSEVECAVAAQGCMATSATNYCAKQHELCNDRLKVALSDTQIEQEVQTVLSQCGMQDYLRKHYDCQCKANEYRSWRRANRMVRETYLVRESYRFDYDKTFYDTDWAPHCFQPEASFQEAFSSCMDNFAQLSVAQILIRQGKDKEEICRCQAEELTRMQASAPGVNSMAIQGNQAQAINRCFQRLSTQ